MRSLYLQELANIPVSVNKWSVLLLQTPAHLPHSAILNMHFPCAIKQHGEYGKHHLIPVQLGDMFYLPPPPFKSVRDLSLFLGWGFEGDVPADSQQAGG